MKLTIQNIGQIKNAEIDLSKDLIVLCGANNSGKTYLAYTVYGLYKYKEVLAQGSIVVDNIAKMLSNIFNNGVITINLKELFFTETSDIIDFLTTFYVKEYLPIVFASSKDFFSTSSVKLEITNEVIERKISKHFVDRVLTFGQDITLQFKKNDAEELLHIILIKEKNYTELSNNFITEISTNIIIEIILDAIFGNIHIEPAERLAVNLFSKELSEKRHKLIDTVLDFDKSKNPLDFIGQQASRYSLPIKDSLNFAERLDVLQKRKSPLAHLADNVEKTILQGKMKVSKTGEVQFSPNNSKMNLGIHLTASVVKSLASIVFYCRHLAKPNDFLIIDEPELNLHPDNQRKIARVLAQMVNAGIKVMISTHSDYVIRELNNLMMLHTKDNEKQVNQLMKKYGYQKDQILDHNKVGAYLFTSEVKALEITNTGFEVKTIDDEINQLNNSANDIFFTLHDND
jgi:energy-coupling factor transporter ATP-binding protein EcfA2